MALHAMFAANHTKSWHFKRCAGLPAQAHTRTAYQDSTAVSHCAILTTPSFLQAQMQQRAGSRGTQLPYPTLSSFPTLS